MADPRDPPAAIYDDGYTPRGDMANRINEQQLDGFAARTSGHSFRPNPFRLRLASGAYVLIEPLRRVGLSSERH